MALLDTNPTYTHSGARTGSLDLKALSGWFAARRATKAEAKLARLAARKRPAHEMNYLADIGMDVGF